LTLSAFGNDQVDLLQAGRGALANLTVLADVNTTQMINFDSEGEPLLEISIAGNH